MFGQILQLSEAKRTRKERLPVATLAHITDPGQWPAGNKVRVNCKAWIESGREKREGEGERKEREKEMGERKEREKEMGERKEREKEMGERYEVKEMKDRDI